MYFVTVCKALLSTGWAAP